MKRIFALNLCLFIVFGIAFAQDTWMPDPKLQRAVRESLDLNPNQPFSRADLLILHRLDLYQMGVKNLKGLEHAKNLTWFSFAENDVSDLSPLAGLTQLQTLYGWVNRKLSDISPLASLRQLRSLDLGVCDISDITPIEKLTRLEILNLSYNQIQNIQPLSHLKQLRELGLKTNAIVDIHPLAQLTGLKTLHIDNNPIADYRPIHALSVSELTRDEVCDLTLGERLPGLLERIENRAYPSVFQAWTRVMNRPELSYAAGIGLHDLYWFCCYPFGLHWRHTYQGVKLLGNLKNALAEREALLAENPNLIILPEIRMRDAFESHFYHKDWEYWIRDASGNRVPVPGYPAYLMDFTHPDVIDLIVQQAIETQRCGLYDGIMLDWWNEKYPVLRNAWSDPGYRGDVAEQRARDEIIKRIREAVGDDFLIIVNTNRRKPLRAARYVNGLFMETLQDNENGYTRDGLIEIESTLLWAEENLREPRINCLEGWGVFSESPTSAKNRRWVRVFTALSLTYSDGYVLFNDGRNHAHNYYDFWDAELGRPVGPKAEILKNIDGLFIREFENGYAVYNRSGKARRIQLPEKVSGVDSQIENRRWHTIPDLDGEIYLKPIPDAGGIGEVGESNPRDLNSDGVVNILDLVIVANAFGEVSANVNVDVNSDGVVNILDLVVVANAFQ